MSDATVPDGLVLATQLVSVDPQVRRKAAEALARLGEAAAPAAAALVRACVDVDEQVREQVVAALEDLGPPPVESVDQLVVLVADTDPLAAYWAVTLLGRVGRDAAGAVTALMRCLESAADPSVRQRAAWALGKIGPGAAVARDTLGRAARGEDPRLARLAAEALEAIGR